MLYHLRMHGPCRAACALNDWFSRNDMIPSGRCREVVRALPPRRFHAEETSGARSRMTQPDFRRVREHPSEFGVQRLEHGQVSFSIG